MLPTFSVGQGWLWMFQKLLSPSQAVLDFPLWRRPCPSCAEGSRAGCRTSSRRAESPPSTYWPQVFGCSTGYRWLSGLQAHTASSCPAFHTPVPLSSSQQGCSQSLHPPACIDTGDWAPAQVQDLALGLVEPHEVHMGTLPELVQVRLDGIPSLRRVSRTAQLGVICRLAEGVLYLAVYVIGEDIKRYRSQYRPLRDTTRIVARDCTVPDGRLQKPQNLPKYFLCSFSVLSSKASQPAKWH